MHNEPLPEKMKVLHRGYKNWVESSKETGMFQGRKDFIEKGNGLFKMKEKTWQTRGTWEALCALISVSIFSLISDEIAKAQVHYRMSDWARNINTFKPLTGAGYQSFLSVQLLFWNAVWWQCEKWKLRQSDGVRQLLFPSSV